MAKSKSIGEMMRFKYHIFCGIMGLCFVGCSSVPQQNNIRISSTPQIINKTRLLPIDSIKIDVPNSDKISKISKISYLGITNSTTDIDSAIIVYMEYQKISDVQINRSIAISKEYLNNIDINTLSNAQATLSRKTYSTPSVQSDKTFIVPAVQSNETFIIPTVMFNELANTSLVISIETDNAQIVQSIKPSIIQVIQSMKTVIHTIFSKRTEISNKTTKTKLATSTEIMDNARKELYSRQMDARYINIDNMRSLEGTKVLDWWYQKLSGDPIAISTASITNINNLRMIGQVTTPIDAASEKNQLDELAWFKERGFNGVLLVWKGEPINKLCLIARALKQDGWVVAVTYGPEETSDTEIYVDPAIYYDMCSMMLPYCDFVIPVWRKATTHHLKINGNIYHNILSGIIREVAPNIPIIGETYTGISKDGLLEMQSSEFTGMAGTLVFNASYNNMSSDKMIELLNINKIPNPFIFCVVGPQPYWEWYPGVHISPNEAIEYNIVKGKELNSLGHGALVLAGGGGGTRKLNGVDVTDDLVNTKWRAGR